MTHKIDVGNLFKWPSINWTLNSKFNEYDDNLFIVQVCKAYPEVLSKYLFLAWIHTLIKSSSGKVLIASVFGLTYERRKVAHKAMLLNLQCSINSNYPHLRPIKFCKEPSPWISNFAGWLTAVEQPQSPFMRLPNRILTQTLHGDHIDGRHHQ